MELSSNLENFLFTPTARVTFTLRSCGVYGPPRVRLSLLLNGEWRKGHNARKVPIYQIKSLIAPRARSRVSSRSQCCCCQLLTRPDSDLAKLASGSKEERRMRYGRQKKGCGRFRVPIHRGRARNKSTFISRGASQIVHNLGQIRRRNVASLEARSVDFRIVTN